MTSQQPNRASHAIHSRHVGFFFSLSGIGKSHKICSHSLLLNLHKAKLHRSNNVMNIYSLAASLTCSNKISKKLKHILLFFPGFSYTAPRKKYPTWRQHEVRTGCVPRRENPLYESNHFNSNNLELFQRFYHTTIMTADYPGFEPGNFPLLVGRSTN